MRNRQHCSKTVNNNTQNNNSEQLSGSVMGLQGICAEGRWKRRIVDGGEGEEEDEGTEESKKENELEEEEEGRERGEQKGSEGDWRKQFRAQTKTEILNLKEDQRELNVMNLKSRNASYINISTHISSGVISLHKNKCTYEFKN